MIELVQSNERWAADAAREAERLTAALGPTVLRVEHIGSTSIPRIVAKPVVDLLPIVASLAEADARSQEVVALGYQWRGEFGISGRRYCTYDDVATGQRRFNVHIFHVDSPDVERHLVFRDYLRVHREEARAYEMVKRRAATMHPDDLRTYSDAKTDWIRACEQRAAAWRRRTSSMGGTEGR